LRIEPGAHSESVLSLHVQLRFVVSSQNAILDKQLPTDGVRNSCLWIGSEKR